jgi:regulator of sirC expression with transglutaminase-like and TPR domain
MLEPRDPRAYLNRALLYEATGNLSSAVADLEAVLKLHADANATRLARARLTELRARLRQAPASLEQ